MGVVPGEERIPHELTMAQNPDPSWLISQEELGCLQYCNVHRFNPTSIHGYVATRRLRYHAVEGRIEQRLQIG